MFLINLKKYADPFTLKEIKGWLFMLDLPKSGADN